MYVEILPMREYSHKLNKLLDATSDEGAIFYNNNLLIFITCETVISPARIKEYHMLRRDILKTLDKKLPTHKEDAATLFKIAFAITKGRKPIIVWARSMYSLEEWLHFKAKTLEIELRKQVSVRSLRTINTPNPAWTGRFFYYLTNGLLGKKNYTTRAYTFNQLYKHRLDGSVQLEPCFIRGKDRLYIKIIDKTGVVKDLIAWEGSKRLYKSASIKMQLERIEGYAESMFERVFSKLNKGEVLCRTHGEVYQLFMSVDTFIYLCVFFFHKRNKTSLIQRGREGREVAKTNIERISEGF